MENDPLIGAQLGAYQVQSTLGEGGMAHVYKAYHSRLRREVAIKVILSEIADREGFQARFEREAQVIASLEHPNIVSVYDFGEDPTLNITYLVMQYVGGGTLRDQLRGVQALDPRQVISYGIQMARALHHAHKRGIVHRDVKPPNMLISSTDPNHLLLSDFGIAKLYASNEDIALSSMPTMSGNYNRELTTVNQVIGTADYMAPEQANGMPVDARTDVYASGIVLYHMLTGEVPFHSTTLRGLLFQQIYTPAPSVRTKNLMIPEVLAQVVLKAMSKAPEDRFQTAEEMARALEYANSTITNALTPFSVSSQQTMPGTGSASRPSNYSPGAMTPPPFSGPVNGSSPSTPSHASGFQVPRTRPITQPGSWGQPGPFQPGAVSPATVGVTNPPVSARSSTTGQRQTVPQRRRRFPLSYILITLVIVVSLVVFGTHFINQRSANSGVNSSTGNFAQAFTENFQDQSRNWSIGNQSNGIVADIANNRYFVRVTPTGTAFASPQAVGTLPANFTLSATMSEVIGRADRLYGLAFRFTEVSSSSVIAYAFLIDKSGDYYILEYGQSSGSSYQTLWQGQYTGIGVLQTLKVRGRANDYTFFINGQNVPVSSSSYTLHTTAIQGGNLALAFSGPNITIATLRVQLSIP